MRFTDPNDNEAPGPGPNMPPYEEDPTTQGLQERIASLEFQLYSLMEYVFHRPEGLEPTNSDTGSESARSSPQSASSVP